MRQRYFKKPELGPKNQVGLMALSLDEGSLATGITRPNVYTLGPVTSSELAPAVTSPLLKTILQTVAPGEQLPAPIETPLQESTVTAQSTVSVQGHVMDEKTGSFLFGVTVTLLGPDGNPSAPPVTLAPDSNTFTVWTSRPDESAISFEKAGYLPTLVSFSDLLYNDQVFMTPGESSPSYLWALLLLVPVLLMAKKKGKRKVSGFDSSNVTTILLIVGGAIGLSLLIKLLQKLGVWAGPGTRSVEDEQKNPFSAWKPQFWKQYTSFTYAIDETEALNDAGIIHGAFKLWTDDFNAIWSVISTMRTQANISYLADIFNQHYEEDLLSFLTDGGGILPWDGLNETHLKTITDYVKSLPTH